MNYHSDVGYTCEDLCDVNAARYCRDHGAPSNGTIHGDASKITSQCENSFHVSMYCDPASQLFIDSRALGTCIRQCRRFSHESLFNSTMSSLTVMFVQRNSDTDIL